MSRQFSIPTVLRMAPKTLLKELFIELGYPEIDRDWAGLKDREVEPILGAISQQPRDKQSRIESELHDLFVLSYNAGIASILEAAEMDGIDDFAGQMPADVGVYHKVLWVRLHHPDVFKRALRIHSFEILTWWRKRNDLPATAVQVDDGLTERLSKALSDLFLQSQGRGSPCTIEVFTRDDGTVYFFAHPDDFAQDATTHDEHRKLQPVTIKTTFSVVFAYNGVDGSLELHAPVPAKLKRKLEELFCRIVLEHEAGDWEPTAAYELNALKDRTFTLATDVEDRVSVQIRAMRLSGRHTGRRNTVEILDDDDNIHDAIDEWIDTRNVPLDQVHATKATLRFEFLELDGRKPGTETFDVTWPSSCNLKGRRAERVAIVEKYLKRWGIDVGKPKRTAVETLEDAVAGIGSERDSAEV